MHVNIQKIIDEISRIAKIESPAETQEEVRELDKQIKFPKLKFVSRGNYVYCYIYEIEYRDSIQRTREKIKESVGKISKDIYLKNKKKIRQMSYEEVKKYEFLEQY